jgi:hypothetical protein
VKFFHPFKVPTSDKKYSVGKGMVYFAVWKPFSHLLGANSMGKKKKNV